MSAEKIHYQLKNTRKNNSWPLIKTLLLPIILLFSLPVMAADVPPVFTNGSPQYLSVCTNSGATNIDNLLTINAIGTGSTETWSVSLAGVHGTLSGFNTSDTTTGAPLTPSGLTYTPIAGYSGIDSFIIQVSDGISSATTTIYVSVHALPTLISSQTPPAICDGTTFNYTPESGFGSATYAWRRPLASGISNAAATGTGGISEVLSNITYYDVTATYIYTITANGCSATANVTATVKPTPRLSSPVLFDTICNGALFTYVPSSNTTATTISWSRTTASGIIPASSSGTGTISETLTNTSSTIQNAVYVFTLSADGCADTRDLTVTVAPPVPITGITTTGPSSVCSNTLYQNFGAATVPLSGVNYSWSAVNATVFAEGASDQYILVNFTNPGSAWVILSANVPGTACSSNDSFAVSVGPATSPVNDVIYTGSQFIYLDNTQSSYQWGYDDAVTLDSTLIPGATFQSYPDSTPDFANNYYWVITSKGGCLAKTYYNSPLAVTNVQAASAEGIKVYPNPAGDLLSVAISGQQGSERTIVIMDMVGRTIKTFSGTQQTIQFDITGIPSGCYLVSSFKNGVKVATTKFIKN